MLRRVRAALRAAETRRHKHSPREAATPVLTRRRTLVDPGLVISACRRAASVGRERDLSNLVICPGHALAVPRRTHGGASIFEIRIQYNDHAACSTSSVRIILYTVRLTSLHLLSSSRVFSCRRAAPSSLSCAGAPSFWPCAAARGRAP